MSTTVINFIKFLKTGAIKLSPIDYQHAQYFQYWRGFADKQKSDSTTKQIVLKRMRALQTSRYYRSITESIKESIIEVGDSKVQGTDKEERLRVRRARPADVPRVLRFVRENAREAWPNFSSQHANFHLILGDYVARALAQGHSMLAEQQEAKQGWTQIRGLAISTTVCPWDAMMLEQWARCVRCKKSRQLVHFTAHCLRAPGLHDKYQVHNILQVVLIVPQNVPRASEIVLMLAKNTIKRGREVGLPVLRFDVTNNSVAKALDNLSLTKEWELSYNLLPDDALKERQEAIKIIDSMKVGKSLIVKDKEEKLGMKPPDKGHFIAVYTANNHVTKI